MENHVVISKDLKKYTSIKISHNPIQSNTQWGYHVEGEICDSLTLNYRFLFWGFEPNEKIQYSYEFESKMFKNSIHADATRRGVIYIRPPTSGNLMDFGTLQLAGKKGICTLKHRLEIPVASEALLRIDPASKGVCEIEVFLREEERGKWKLYESEPLKGGLLAEFVPLEESLENWSKMFIIYNNKNIKPKDIWREIQDYLKKNMVIQQCVTFFERLKARCYTKFSSQHLNQNMKLVE